MILIGSRALYLRCPQALTRKPMDFDFVAKRDEAEKWVEDNARKIGMTKRYAEKSNTGMKMICEGSTNVELELVEPKGDYVCGSGDETPTTITSNDLLLQLMEGNPESIETPFGWVPTLDMLFTIKMSHRYLRNSPHFWKTVVDYHIMKRLGAKVRPEYQEFLKLREKETYNYKHPKLNQGKDTFFADDNIDYVWDHDTIHESVARGERPAYTYYMKDGEQVMTSKEKFFACPREVQLNGIIEEAAVLAIERSLVPHPGVWTPDFAWKFALAKVCSSITSGWFREFGYENLPEIVKMYPAGYWEKFQADCESGRVKPFTGKKYS